MATTTLTPYVTEYLRSRLARGEIGPKTAVDYAYTLHAFALLFGARPLTRLSSRFVDSWLESIGRYAPTTRRHRLSMVAGFCRWMTERKRIPRDPTVHVPPIRQPRRVPVTLTRAEVGRLLAACPNARARAIVTLMIGVGCRCIEVSRLQAEDYDPEARTLILVGKGGHQRFIPVPAMAAAAIDAYLDEVGRVSGPLIRSELDNRSPLTAQTISDYVRWWMVEAGVKTRSLDGRSAHGLRRTAGSDVMERAGDIRIVQEMLGHARIETTAKSYLRPVPLDKLREAMEGRTYQPPAA